MEKPTQLPNPPRGGAGAGGGAGGGGGGAEFGVTGAHHDMSAGPPGPGMGQAGEGRVLSGQLGGEAPQRMVEAGGLQGNGLGLLTLTELMVWRGGTDSTWGPTPLQGKTGLLQYLGLYLTKRIIQMVSLKSIHPHTRQLIFTIPYHEIQLTVLWVN